MAGTRRQTGPIYLRTLKNRIIEARRSNLNVMVVATQGAQNDPAFVPAQDALRFVKTLNPEPLPSDRDAAAETLSKADISGAQAVWLSSGVDFGSASTFGSCPQ